MVVCFGNLPSIQKTDFIVNLSLNDKTFLKVKRFQNTLEPFIKWMLLIILYPFLRSFHLSTHGFYYIFFRN